MHDDFSIPLILFQTNTRTISECHSLTSVLLSLFDITPITSRETVLILSKIDTWVGMSYCVIREIQELTHERIHHRHMIEYRRDVIYVVEEYFIGDVELRNFIFSRN